MRTLLPALALVSALAPPPRAQEPFRFAREGVLGTNANLVVTAPDRAAAERVEAMVFAEVERLAAIVSTWDEASELSRLVRAGGGAPSTELARVLERAEGWRRDTDGALDPGVAVLTALWREAEKRNAPPDPATLHAAAAGLATPAIELGEAGARVRGPVTVDAFAKGWIVDAASAVVGKVDGAVLVAFQIGGDTRVGTAPHDVAIADPRAPADNGEPLCTVRLRGDAVASSGGYARGFTIAGVRHSHVLDPRTGAPCDDVLGASVIAPDTATADALATALCVLGTERGLPLLARHRAEGVLVTADGTVHQSPGFGARAIGAIRTAPAAGAAGAGTGGSNEWPAGFGLTVEFDLQGPAGGASRGWRRPYVAVWVEDAIGDPARTLCLWIENRRWLRDLRRWSRQYAELPDVLETVSQATRKAGHYTLTWDGTSDEGHRLVPGKYTVCIEVVREHGSYQLVKREVELRGEPLAIDVEGNPEMAAAKITFGALPGGKR